MPRKVGQGLRVDVVAAVQVELSRTGLIGFKAGVISSMFRGKIGQDTLARWIRDAVVAEDTRQRRCASSASSGAAVDETSSNSPMSRTALDRLAGRSRSITRRLDDLMEVAEDCLRDARGEHGRPRSPKLVLNALEQGRRCVHTAALLTKQLHEIDRVDRLHALVIDEIEKESPACAKRIVGNLDQILGNLDDIR